MFKCNCYVNQFERVNEKYCNGWMHAVLNKSPTLMCLAKKKKKKGKKKKRHGALDTLLHSCMIWTDRRIITKGTLSVFSCPVWGEQNNDEVLTSPWLVWSRRGCHRIHQHTSKSLSSAISHTSNANMINDRPVFHQNDI